MCVPDADRLRHSEDGPLDFKAGNGTLKYKKGMINAFACGKNSHDRHLHEALIGNMISATSMPKVRRFDGILLVKMLY